MKIEFRLFDKTTSSFKIVYFQEWKIDKRQPLFTSNPKKAKEYWHDRLAEEDVNLLKRAESRTAVTLSIKLVT
ncbi:hypothetical protein [Enterococcus wangshanyuanii]|uniref:Uncharacterized protein n=1 Tax=Enterococcus wangshanyuanii TaxID=2005703 RepID=A0ABQ1PSY3_9ENTE|nr:hypothetical protein [Enterococcus wangshanyuanii]GGD03220.1 hypothetical protein GCM10011573_35860 [Enterococcus wangshanyuanii]